jgi:hypothetical protein
MRYSYRARRGTSWTETQKTLLAEALREALTEVSDGVDPTGPLEVRILPDGVEVADLKALPYDLIVLFLAEADRTFARVMGFPPMRDHDDDDDGGS